ncbi:hypothetical protein LEMLEM_LOCUS14028 [Lemmus lemmus]
MPGRLCQRKHLSLELTLWECFIQNHLSDDFIHWNPDGAVGEKSHPPHLVDKKAGLFQFRPGSQEWDHNLCPV